MGTALKLENIRKILGKNQILKDVSFSVKSGDIFGYLGPNGAGKTTTIRIILGLFEADSGKLEVLGRDIHDPGTRKKIGFVLDLDGLYDGMTGRENLVFYASIYDADTGDEKIDRLLDLVELAGRGDDKVHTYSTGMRRRLALARSMVHDPELLILDEPTSGVDPSGQIQIRKIMLDLAKKEKKTIFLSSHNLDEVQRICNRIAIIDRGEIKLYGELEELRRQMGNRGLVIKTMSDVPRKVIDDIKKDPALGLRKFQERKLLFLPDAGIGTPEILNILSGYGVEVDEAIKQEATLEEMYSSILKEAEGK